MEDLSVWTMSTPHILGGDLSELVRDSRLDVIFERGCTIHPRAAATRRENYSHEKWFPHQDPVGKGGMGLVYVEERERAGSRPVSLRAVKKIQLSGRPEQKKMIRRELEAMFKFSQPRVGFLFLLLRLLKSYLANLPSQYSSRVSSSSLMDGFSVGTMSI
jgi:hypothetical protein